VSLSEEQILVVGFNPFGLIPGVYDPIYEPGDSLPAWDEIQSRIP
jgi:hypothetical protein